MWHSRRGEAFALAAIIIVFFVVRWPFRELVLIRDEGEYAHLGQRILQGDIPYRDVYNQKTPVVFYFFAAVQKLAGDGLAGLRIATTLVGMATASTLFILARRIFGTVGALATVVAFMAMTFDQCGVVHPSSTEFFMLLWLAAGAWLWLGALRQDSASDGLAPWRALLAGVAAGLAYQTKQTGLTLIVFFALERVWRAWFARDASSSNRARRAAVAAKDVTFALAGFVLVLGAFLAYFARNGALDAYIDCTWWNNFAYVGRRHEGLAGLFALARNTLTSVTRWDIGLWLCGGAALAWGALRRDRTPASGLWILLALTAGASCVAGRSYVHYWEPLIVPLALGNGLAVELVVGRARAASGATHVLLAAALLVPFIGPVWNGLEYARMDGAERSGLIAGKAWNQPFAASRGIADYIAQRTRPDEPFLILGSEPQIHYYADRPSSSRMVITYPMVAPYPYSAALRREFLDAFEAAPPRYVLYVRSIFSLTEWPQELQSFVTPIEQILQRKYTIETGWPMAGGPALDPASASRADLVLFRRSD